MTENKNVPVSKTLNLQWVRFGHFVIWYSNLFQISDFDLPAMPLSYHYEIMDNGVAPTVNSLKPETMHGRRVFGFCLNMAFRSGAIYAILPKYCIL